MSEQPTHNAPLGDPSDLDAFRNEVNANDGGHGDNIAAEFNAWMDSQEPAGQLAPVASQAPEVTPAAEPASGRYEARHRAQEEAPRNHGRLLARIGRRVSRIAERVAGAGSTLESTADRRTARQAAGERIQQGRETAQFVGGVAILTADIVGRQARKNVSDFVDTQRQKMNDTKEDVKSLVGITRIYVGMRATQARERAQARMEKSMRTAKKVGKVAAIAAGVAVVGLPAAAVIGVGAAGYYGGKKGIELGKAGAKKAGEVKDAAQLAYHDKSTVLHEKARNHLHNKSVAHNQKAEQLRNKR